MSALAALSADRHRVHAALGLRSLKLDEAWIATIFVLTVLIGLRFEVGADWAPYLVMVQDARYLSLADILQLDDPGYKLLNWISAQMDWGIYGVNLIGGAIFSIGLAVFCRSLPRPWLALAVAVPYVVIVVAMGYNRQAIALGLAMLGLVVLGRRQIRWFVFWVVLGATFHKSAVILLPIAAMADTRSRYWTALWVGVTAFGAYLLLLEKVVDAYVTRYGAETVVQSQGAMIRLLMNMVPAVILLVWRRRFEFAEAEAVLWRWFAVISLACLTLFLVSPSSTAVDRVALYMLPLQLVVFAHLPDVLGKRGQRNEVVVLVLLYYAVVQFVWLNYAQHATAWLPYRFFPPEAW
ncbi:MAG: EpsG family protein [Pseudomonadales bacterium]